MKVLKFGGTSLGSQEAILKVLSILMKRINKNEKIIVVVSAFSGVTDQLIELSTLKENGKKQDTLFSIKNRHINIITSLFTQTEQENVLQQFENVFQELVNALHIDFHNPYETKKHQDYIIGFGERFSAQIITSCLNKYNINALYTDTRSLIKTNEDYGFAKIKKNISYKNISEYYNKNENSIIIATGFIASTLDGFSTTLGRGGSDYTASIIGAATQADAVEIWTDVNGLMTADPNIVKSALPITQVSYRTAQCFSKYGAKVIYPPTIEPATKYDIPIYIKNTFNPELNGTLIHNKTIQSNNNIYGISTIPNVNLLTVRGVKLKQVRNTLLEVFERESFEINIIESSMDEESINIVFLSQSISASVIKIERSIRKLLNHQVDNVEILQGLSMITIIGKVPTNSTVKDIFSDSLNSYNVAVKSMIYNNELETLSIFTERNYQDQLLNDLHDNFITSNEFVNT